MRLRWGGRGRRRLPAGLTEQRLDTAGRDARLAPLGDDEAACAARLDERAGALAAGVTALSELTSGLSVAYGERLERALSGMAPRTGVLLMVRGYAAHLAVEEDPAAFTVDELPVLGTLPERVPQDLLSRVVKASRRHFGALCPLPPAVWQGFVVWTTWRVHAGRLARRQRGNARQEPPSASGGAAEAAPGWVGDEVVDGLLKVGWILRQVDLHYGLEPERT